MNTLKTVVVIAVLAIVGYGLYIGLNNGFDFQHEPPPTPDWIANEIAPAPSPPSVQFGEAADGPPATSVPNTFSGTLAPPDGGPTATYPGVPGTSLGSPISPPTGGPSADANAPGSGNTSPFGSGTNSVMPNGPPPSTTLPGSPLAGTLAPGGTLPPSGNLPGSAVPGNAAPGAAPPAVPGTATAGIPGSALPGAMPSPPNTPSTPPSATPPSTTLPPADATVPGSGLAMPLASGAGSVGRDTSVGGNAEMTNAAGTGVPPANSAIPKGGGGSADTFAQAMSAVKTQLDAGQLSSALLTLSIWYEDPRMTPEQQNQLVRILDQVAGTVIYSRKHLIEGAYRVKPGETLADIATTYKIPPGLLAKINGVGESARLEAGQELKVVRGPFNAVIDSKKQILTLWLAGRYAGRFNIRVGPEFEKIVGSFVVQDKIRHHTGNNGHGWIGLGAGFQPVSTGASSGTRLGIAGMQAPADAAGGAVPGRIGVSVGDADDLFDILSQGSKVTISR